MNRLEDLRQHQPFGRWIVLERGPNSPAGAQRWWCQCAYGMRKLVLRQTLENHESKSCGCYIRDITAERNRTHNLSRTSEYGIWCRMKDRCYNPKIEQYPNYGGRGITVCEEWINSFETFLKDMGPRPSPQHSIDRIDNNSSYCKDNCRWATAMEQAANKRNNHMITLHGETAHLREWLRRLNLHEATYRGRRNRGMSEEEALLTPPITKFYPRIPDPDTYMITLHDETASLTTWLQRLPLSRLNFRNRLNLGWSIEKALTTPLDLKYSHNHKITK